MNSEEKARQKIDAMLTASGWQAQQLFGAELPNLLNELNEVLAV